MIRVEVPGKVVLAGEYSVLLPGTPCLVSAVDRSVVLSATPGSRWSVRSGDATWSDGAPVPEALRFVVAAIEAVRLRVPVSPMSVVTSDTMHEGELKLGLGGSAAATVGGVSLAARGSSLTAEECWAIADEVHRREQGGKGSGADVAASFHGGVQRYWREPRQCWPVAVHPSVRLLLAWTGASVKTSPRLERWNAFVRESPETALAFAETNSTAVRRVEAALVAGDVGALRGSVQMARAALKALEVALRVELETPALRTAADAAFRAGGVGKLSGAGGGDCAVLFAIGDDGVRQVADAVRSAGLDVFPVAVAAHGVQCRELP